MFIKNTTINANISIIFRLNKGYIIKLKKQYKNINIIFASSFRLLLIRLFDTRKAEDYPLPLTFIIIRFFNQVTYPFR